MIKIIKDSKEIKVDNLTYILNIAPLDNFTAFGFKFNGQYFQTSEHAFQYLKFVDTKPSLAKQIKNAFSPNTARDLGQANKHLKPKNWIQVKYENMEKVLRAKAEQNPVVMEKLLATKDYIIAEYCIDEDTDWGLDRNLKGQNNLGKIWMKLRDEFKAKITNK